MQLLMVLPTSGLPELQADMLMLVFQQNILQIVLIINSPGCMNDVEEEEILIPVGWKKIQAFEF